MRRLARAKTAAAAAWFVRSNGKKRLLLQPDILGQHRQKDFVGGERKKKKSPYILWQAEMMLLRLFITVSTSRIVEALKRKSKRKRFGLCLRCCCCCCFWCSLIHNKIAAAMARACSPRMYLFDLNGRVDFFVVHTYNSLLRMHLNDF